MRSLHYNHAGAIGYSGWNGACSTVHQMKVYGYGTEDVDPRLSLNFYTDMDYVDECGSPVNDGATDQDLEYMPLEAVVDFPAGADAHKVKCAGARFKKYEFDRSTTINECINNDLVIWRYADALLLKAEAEYRLGNTGAALELVNQVRNRVNAEPRTALTLNDLLNERMLELAVRIRFVSAPLLNLLLTVTSVYGIMLPLVTTITTRKATPTFIPSRMLCLI